MLELIERISPVEDKVQLVHPWEMYCQVAQFFPRRKETGGRQPRSQGFSTPWLWPRPTPSFVHTP